MCKSTEKLVADKCKEAEILHIYHLKKKENL